MDSCYTHVNNYFKGDIQLFSSIEGYFPLMNILYKVDPIYQNLFYRRYNQKRGSAGLLHLLDFN